MPRPLPTHVYHAIPLHNVPYLYTTGTLYSSREIKRLGLPIRSRPTVAKRDRKLGLDAYIHLSLQSCTPLLAHKWERGWPHALLAFSFETVCALPGWAWQKFNAKNWAHRDEFVPVSDANEKQAVLTEWQNGRYPSLELLVPEALPLYLSHTLAVSSEAERDWLRHFGPLVPTLPHPTANASLFPATIVPQNWPAFHAYYEACNQSGTVLPPPNLPFD